MTIFSDVNLTVYHKCYFMKINQTFPGYYREYPYFMNSDAFNIRTFTPDTSCQVNLTFEFVNSTSDPATGISNLTRTSLTFPNPYFNYNYATNQFKISGNA